MTDLISAALRERADGDIHIERLLAAVHAGARRRRRRRVAVTACAVVAAVAVAAAGSVAVSRTGGAPVRPAASASPGSPGEIPRPPVLEGVPVASFTPTALGADPTLFHLDITGLAASTGLSWSSRPGYEELRATSAEEGGEVIIEASQSRDRLTGLADETSPTEVNGLPAELARTTTTGGAAPRGGYAVRWEPVPGVWAQVVVAFDPEAAVRIAERVRLDRTLRCALPFRFSGLGDRVRVIKCETSFSGGRTYGAVWLAVGDAQAEYYVTVWPPVTNPNPPTETIGGRAVAVLPGSAGPGGFPQIEYVFDGGLAVFCPFYTTVDDPFLRSLVPAFVPVVDPDPGTWPRSPLD
jgi:hypothetical protein